MALPDVIKKFTSISWVENSDEPKDFAPQGNINGMWFRLTANVTNGATAPTDKGLKALELIRGITIEYGDVRWRIPRPELIKAIHEFIMKYPPYVTGANAIGGGNTGNIYAEFFLPIKIMKEGNEKIIITISWGDKDDIASANAPTINSGSVSVYGLYDDALAENNYFFGRDISGSSTELTDTPPTGGQLDAIVFYSADETKITNIKYTHKMVDVRDLECPAYLKLLDFIAKGDRTANYFWIDFDNDVDIMSDDKLTLNYSTTQTTYVGYLTRLAYSRK